MKIALFFFLLSGMGLWSLKNLEENNTTYDEKMADSLNLLSNDENIGNSNLFEQKRGDEFEKRHDAVIGTEYWGERNVIWVNVKGEESKNKIIIYNFFLQTS